MSAAARRSRDSRLDVYGEEIASHERLASIETRLANMESVHSEMRVTQDALRKEFKHALDAHNERLTQIHLDLARYRGAWGSLVMVFTAIWAVVTLSRDWIMAHWK
jgi:hypothetical protein